MQTEIRCGCYVLHIPIRYMKPEADQGDKDVLEAYKVILKNLVDKGYGSIILPALTDDQGNKLFDLKYVGPEINTSFTRNH